MGAHTYTILHKHTYTYMLTDSFTHTDFSTNVTHIRAHTHRPTQTHYKHTDAHVHTSIQKRPFKQMHAQTSTYIHKYAHTMK